MRVIRKALKLSREEYFKKHLLIINNILPIQMTNKEAEVLSAFMCLEGDLAKEPFSTTGRKIVLKKLGLTHGGLGNYLGSLKKKGFIKVQGEDMSILPILIPESEVQQYNFELSYE